MSGITFVDDVKVECGRTWPSWIKYGDEHVCSRDQDHDGPHECMCGANRHLDGADDDREASA